MFSTVPRFYVILKSFHEPVEPFVAQTENSVRILHMSERTSHELKIRVIWEHIH